MMNNTITNGSECYAQFKCLDVSGNLFTPTSLSYQVWDTTNNIEIVSATPVSPNQTGSITITASQNSMNVASTLYEARTITLKVGIPGGTFENVPSNYTLVRAAGTP